MERPPGLPSPAAWILCSNYVLCVVWSGLRGRVPRELGKLTQFVLGVIAFQRRLGILVWTRAPREER